MDLPTIERKKPKAPYRKPDAVKLLETLAMDEARLLHPTMPHLAPRKYRDDSANGLTKCIIDFLVFSGHQAERINSTGRYIDNTKIVSDVLGFKKKIGSGQWIKGSGQKGTADISSTILGLSVKIEIKVKDSQSEYQKKYQQQVESAGGLYWICHNMDEFLTLYNGIK